MNKVCMLFLSFFLLAVSSCSKYKAFSNELTIELDVSVLNLEVLVDDLEHEFEDTEFYFRVLGRPEFPIEFETISLNFYRNEEVFIGNLGNKFYPTQFRLSYFCDAFESLDEEASFRQHILDVLRENADNLEFSERVNSSCE